MLTQMLCLAAQMFGWTQAEIEGRNVSALMPHPYSSQHDSYIQQYQDSGNPRVLNTARDLHALHKDRWVFAVRLAVIKIVQNGKHSCLQCSPPRSSAAAFAKPHTGVRPLCLAAIDQHATMDRPLCADGYQHCSHLHTAQKGVWVLHIL